MLYQLSYNTSPFPITIADDYDGDYDGGAGFEGAFEGFHDNHTQLQEGQPGERLGGVPMSHSFEGVEPMGEFLQGVVRCLVVIYAVQLLHVNDIHSKTLWT